MKYSNKLDLDKFFFNVRDQAYVIVKDEDFPNYYKGSDIDVFCYDKGTFTKRILSIANSYLDKGFEVKVSNKSESQTYIDFFLNGELEFRFDLYESLPQYKKIHLKPYYILSVIENATIVQREFNDSKYPIRVPSKIDDFLLRYVEYIEWYELRPDKIKHLDYIIEKIDEDKKTQFLNKLHYYTAFPEYSDSTPAQEHSWKKNVSEIYSKLKQKSLPEILVAVFRRVRRLGMKILRAIKKTVYVSFVRISGRYKRT